MTTNRSADRHTTDRHPISIDEQDWNDLGNLVGDRNRSDVIRRLIRAFLQRPDATMPRQGDYETPTT